MESRNRGSELLNGPAAHTCINRRLEEMRADDVCAVFMADLDDMSEIAENAGKDRAEQAQDRLSSDTGPIVGSRYKRQNV